MDSSSYFNVPQLISGIFGLGIALLPIFGIIWLFAWIKDIRQDTRKIREVLKRKFPEEFDDE
jgi:hypothetical protein